METDILALVKKLAFGRFSEGGGRAQWVGLTFLDYLLCFSLGLFEDLVSLREERRVLRVLTSRRVCMPFEF